MVNGIICYSLHIWLNLPIISSSHLIACPFSENGSLHSTPTAESSYERKVLRVRESLGKLKRRTDSAALGFLSRLLDTKLDENEKGLFDVSVYLHLISFSSVFNMTLCAFSVSPQSVISSGL